MNQKNDKKPKETFGPFTLLQCLGSGRTSEVFKVQKRNSIFALKRIKPHFKYDRDIISAFILEADILGQIKENKYFPIFYEAGEIEDSHYILMEYIHGLDLKTLIRQSIFYEKRLSWQEACAIAAEICEALEYLHDLQTPDGRNVIHKDVKAANILVSTRGEVKLIDLSLKHGTSKYIPLERLEKKIVGPYSDIFATGNILYEMLHGRPLIKRDSELGSYFEMKETQIEEDLFDPSLSKRVRRVLVKALKQDSTERYQAVRDFKKDLLEILQEENFSWNPATLGKEIQALKLLPLTLPIQPMGRLQKIDAEGFLINGCRLEKIRPPWNEAVEAMKQAYLKNLPGIVHSIYLRGSVPRGNAIEGVSDIDSLAVIHGNLKSLDLSWVPKVVSDLKIQFPFCPYPEFDFIPYENLLNDEGFFSRRFIIKVLSACIYGEDLAPKFPKFKPSSRIAFYFHGNIEQVLKQAAQRIETYLDPEQIRGQCAWVMKRILRTGFGLTIEREGVFTRDLYPCYEIFSKYYPEQESQMIKALEWAVNPTDEKKLILDYIGSFGPWLAKEAKKRFSKT
jgi:tRNA A-37 threonylcarbamoyl transferase component Bud32